MVIWEGYSFELTRVKNYEIKEVKIKSVGDHHVFRKGGEDEGEASESTSRE